MGGKYRSCRLLASKLESCVRSTLSEWLE